MDLTYATIPTLEGTFVMMHREPMRRYHVEDTKDQENEIISCHNDMGCYTVFTNNVFHEENTDKF